jgi:hypothetical protein
MRQHWIAPLPPFRVASGAAFNTFTTLQQILVDSTHPAPFIPANMLDVGMELHLEADGEFSNTSTPTLGLGFMMGAATPVTALATTTALTTTTGAVSWPWHAEWHGQVRAVGTAGTIYGSGWWIIGTALNTMSAIQAIPVTAAARSVTWDTTAAQALAPGAVWGTSSVSNTIKVDQFRVWLVN